MTTKTQIKKWMAKRKMNKLKKLNVYVCGMTTSAEAEFMKMSYEYTFCFRTGDQFFKLENGLKTEI